MAKKVTRTDTAYRVELPGENGGVVIQDCATQKEALEWCKSGGVYVGEVKVKREMPLEVWLATSVITPEKKEEV